MKVFSPKDSDVISADDRTHVMLSMWDENMISILVDESLSLQIRVDDIVLVDYRPISETLPVPRFLVTKVLRGDVAAETWRIYREKYRAMKGKPLPLISSQGAPIQPPHSYIG